MARKTMASVLVFGAILLLLFTDAAVASSEYDAGTITVEGGSTRRGYPEGCRRTEPCPADTGAECEYHTIPKLPCSCAEVRRCDPHARGCSEITIAGLRPCDF